MRALVDYAAQPEADVAAAMMAVGYLVSRHAKEDAMQTLVQEFLAGSHAEEAALGLTLSGDPRARTLLEEAAARAVDPVASLTLAAQAKENARVEQMGLRAHYLNPPQPEWLSVPDQGPGASGPMEGME